MITLKTLARLAGNPADLCPHRWPLTNRRHGFKCRVTDDTHLCAGDARHRGKHVCPCGALEAVALP